MKKKVLFVCLGNICRSPLAEALFMKHVKERGLADKYMADSCGTESYHIGEQPDARSRANARENGLEYSHAARHLREEDYKEFDLIIPMDSSNQQFIEQHNSDKDAAVRLMRNYDTGYEGHDVPDPYYSGEEGFQNVFEILDRSTGALLDQLEE
ncbi:MAG: low molecular weight protein-tyrosine-phosphatase [Bacteroidota bacterium]